MGMYTISWITGSEILSDVSCFPSTEAKTMELGGINMELQDGNR